MEKRPKPREMPGNMTPRQRRENWWHYHWLYVLAAVLAAAAVSFVIWEQVTKERYDCSVALVTRYAVTPEEVASLQAALEAVCPDGNGDGRVRVAVNAIQIDYTSTDLDDAAIQVMTTNVAERDFPAGRPGELSAKPPGSHLPGRLHPSGKRHGLGEHDPPLYGLAGGRVGGDGQSPAGPAVVRPADTDQRQGQGSLCL